MKKYVTVFCAITTILLLGASCTMTPPTSTETPTTPTAPQNAVERVPSVQNKTNTQDAEADQSAISTQDDPLPQAPASGRYTTYDASIVANQSEEDIVILFFHASWCPTCAALEKDIQSHLSDIPSNVTILKTDYPGERELIKKYGVTYQHTLVRVDRTGERITQWSGGNTLNSILSHIR